MEAPRQPPMQADGTAQLGLKIRLFTLPKEATETGFLLVVSVLHCCTFLQHFLTEEVSIDTCFVLFCSVTPQLSCSSSAAATAVLLLPSALSPLAQAARRYPPPNARH